MFLCIRRIRRRRQRDRRVQDRLRRLGESLVAPEHVKRDGLERLMDEFECSREPKR
jgi:hypothetical protein